MASKAPQKMQKVVWGAGAGDGSGFIMMLIRDGTGLQRPDFFPLVTDSLTRSVSRSNGWPFHQQAQQQKANSPVFIHNSDQHIETRSGNFPTSVDKLKEILVFTKMASILAGCH